MRPITGNTIKAYDWCHKCGNRDEMSFVEFTIPDNAEHSTCDGKRGYFRICERCAFALYTAATAPNPAVVLPPVEEQANRDQPTLSEWIEQWECEYRDGQTTISRSEAIRRYEREYGE